MSLFDFFWPVFVSGGVFLALYFYQERKRNANSVDLAWALMTGVMGVYLAGVSQGDFSRRILVAALAFYWSSRLGWHLWSNRVRGSLKEDSRYARFRILWGQGASRKFLGLYLVNAGLVLILGTSFGAAASNSIPFGNPWDWIGLSIWSVAVLGESLADRQLREFAADPRNKGGVCKRGLWRYSRHPNYFFEWLHWLSYIFLAIPGAHWPWALLAPAVMYLLLTRVTGIPPSERSSLESRGDLYRMYQKETSAFFPWFPKK